MARKLTEQEYAQKISNLGYTYISGYERSTSKCKLRCPKGHLRESNAYNIQRSPKCPTCVKLENRDKSLKEFLKYIKENAEEYTYISGYKTTQDKCLMKHEKCGTEWEVKPNNFTCSHSRCPTCVDKRNTLYITEEKWKKYVEDCLPEHTYLGGFTRMKDKCLMQHSCGYTWEVKPESVKRGDSWCPKCSHSTTVTESDFVKRLKLINPKIEYVSGFTDMHSKCTMKCLVCGYVWNTSTTGNLVRGHGCPSCAKVHVTLQEFKDTLDDKCYKIEYVGGFKNMITPCTMKCLVCGNVWNTTAPTDIIGGVGCPKCKLSRGEKFITKYLTKNNIKYECPKKFADLYDRDPNIPLRYDFHLPKYNLLIEYQGKQHYFMSLYYGGLDTFAKQNLHDDMKRDYAKSHGYNLLEVPYTANTQEKVDDYLADYLARLEEKVGGI